GRLGVVALDGGQRRVHGGRRGRAGRRRGRGGAGVLGLLAAPAAVQRGEEDEQPDDQDEADRAADQRLAFPLLPGGLQLRRPGGLPILALALPLRIRHRLLPAGSLRPAPPERGAPAPRPAVVPESKSPGWLNG